MSILWHKSLSQQQHYPIELNGLSNKFANQNDLSEKYHFMKVQDLKCNENYNNLKNLTENVSNKVFLEMKKSSSTKIISYLDQRQRTHSPKQIMEHHSILSTKNQSQEPNSHNKQLPFQLNNNLFSASSNSVISSPQQLNSYNSSTTNNSPKPMIVTNKSKNKSNNQQLFSYLHSKEQVQKQIEAPQCIQSKGKDTLCGRFMQIDVSSIPKLSQDQYSLNPQAILINQNQSKNKHNNCIPFKGTIINRPKYSGSEYLKMSSPTERLQTPVKEKIIDNTHMSDLFPISKVLEYDTLLCHSPHKDTYLFNGSVEKQQQQQKQNQKEHCKSLDYPRFQQSQKNYEMEENSEREFDKLQSQLEKDIFISKQKILNFQQTISDYLPLLSEQPNQQKSSQTSEQLPTEWQHNEQEFQSFPIYLQQLNKQLHHLQQIFNQKQVQLKNESLSLNEKNSKLSMKLQVASKELINFKEKVQSLERENIILKQQQKDQKEQQNQMSTKKQQRNNNHYIENNDNNETTSNQENNQIQNEQYLEDKTPSEQKSIQNVQYEKQVSLNKVNNQREYMYQKKVLCDDEESNIQKEIEYVKKQLSQLCEELNQQKQDYHKSKEEMLQQNEFLINQKSQNEAKIKELEIQNTTLTTLYSQLLSKQLQQDQKQQQELQEYKQGKQNTLVNFSKNQDIQFLNENKQAERQQQERQLFKNEANEGDNNLQSQDQQKQGENTFVENCHLCQRNSKQKVLNFLEEAKQIQDKFQEYQEKIRQQVDFIIDQNQSLKQYIKTITQTKDNAINTSKDKIEQKEEINNASEMYEDDGNDDRQEQIQEQEEEVFEMRQYFKQFEDQLRKQLEIMKQSSKQSILESFYDMNMKNERQYQKEKDREEMNKLQAALLQKKQIQIRIEQ